MGTIWSSQASWELELGPEKLLEVKAALSFPEIPISQAKDTPT